MKTLRINIISILFIIFTTNCIGMIKPQQKDMQPNSGKINIKKPWNSKKLIQDVIHGRYENAQFEVKQQPIPIQDLTKKVLSFINGEKSINYIIIGIVENKDYNYKIIKSESSFDALLNKENGIYRVNRDRENEEYYQVINNEELKLILNEKNNEFDLNDEFDFSKAKNGDNISFTIVKNLFKSNANIKYTYKIMAETDFKALFTEGNKKSKVNGIYRITINGVDKYYQVISNNKSELNLQKNEGIGISQFKNGDNITFAQLNNLFDIAYKYIIMSETNFKDDNNKENGIYKVTTNEVDKYYQVIDNIKYEANLKETDKLKFSKKKSNGIINFKDIKNLGIKIDSTYKYIVMSETDFKDDNNKENGIYRTTINGVDKYYQVIDNNKYELNLNKNNNKNCISIRKSGENLSFAQLNQFFDINYKYITMSETNFKDDNNKENGIYKVTTNEVDKYYQVIDNNKSELTYRASLEIEGKIPYTKAKKLFINIKGNPIDSYNVKHIEVPINIEKTESYCEIECYIKNIGVSLQNCEECIGSIDNSSILASYEDYVKNKIIIPYPTKEKKESEILLLTISPHTAGFVRCKDSKDFYHRDNQGDQSDYGSYPMSNNTDIINQKLKQRLFNHLKYLCNQTQNISEFQRLFVIVPNDLKTITDNKGNNLLMIAVNAGNKDVVKFLISESVNMQSYVVDCKQIPIWLVAYNQDKDIAKILLKNNPKLLKLVDTSENNIFMTACINHDSEFVNYLLENFTPHNIEEENRLTKHDLENVIKRLEKNITENNEEIKQLINNKLGNLN